MTRAPGLPLVSLDIRAEVCGFVASSVVVATFANDADSDAVDATVVMPLPDDAAVVGCEVVLGGRLVTATLLERSFARREQRAAADAGVRHAIVEEERASVFSLRVGLLPAGERAVVTLRLSGSLDVDGDDVVFRMPLVVAPRLIPGLPLAAASVGAGVVGDTDVVRDASRITPPVLAPRPPSTRPPVVLSIAVDLDVGAAALTGVQCSHVHQQRADGHRTLVTIADHQALDRDFSFRFTPDTSALRTQLRVVGDPNNPATSTLLLTVALPAAPTTGRRAVVFVVDRSAPMAGALATAARLVRDLVATYTTDDRVRVFATGDDIRTAGAGGDGLDVATDGVKAQAHTFIAGLEANGGAGALVSTLERALAALRGASDVDDRVLVLITRGHVGHDRAVIAALAAADGVRVVAVGVDRAPNLGLLHSLARRGRGHCVVIDPVHEVGARLPRLRRLLQVPLAQGLSLTLDGTDVVEDSRVPRRLPPLIGGEAVTVLARCQTPSGSVRATLRGTRSDGGSVVVDVERGTARTGPDLRAAHARALLRELEDEFDESRGTAVSRERIVQTSLDAGVLCRFTAFFAVDDEAVDLAAAPTPVMQPIEAPASTEPKKPVPHTRARLGELLVRENLISLQQLQRAQEGQRVEGGRLGSHLTRLGYIEAAQLAEFLSKLYGVPAINLSEFEIDRDVLRLLPREVVEKHQLVPVNRAGGSLIVAMVDPSNIFAIDDVKFLTGYNVEVVVASEADMARAIADGYGDRGSDALAGVNIDELMSDFDEDVDVAERSPPDDPPRREPKASSATRATRPKARVYDLDVGGTDASVDAAIDAWLTEVFNAARDAQATLVVVDAAGDDEEADVGLVRMGRSGALTPVALTTGVTAAALLRRLRFLGAFDDDARSGIIDLVGVGRWHVLFFDGGVVFSPA